MFQVETKDGVSESVLRYRDRTLKRAGEQFAAQNPQSREEMLALYRKFLKIENHRLKLRHLAGGGGLEIAQRRAVLIDVLLRNLFDYARRFLPEAAKVEKDLALVAIGGYGRGELNPFSDVDLMFLHGNSLTARPEQMNGVIEMVLYMLWDAGFKVGHSTRSVAGAIKQANQDMQSKTSLLESRLIAGNVPLFAKFEREFERHCVKGHEKEYIEDRVKDQLARHAKFGGVVYMQEPNIKGGCGGLRDYQNLIWIGFFKTYLSEKPEFSEKKLLNESERRRLERAYDFLMRVRTDLHYLNKRSTEVLTLRFQGELANRFHYPQKNQLRRIEAFMRDYYRHARDIYHITETVSERLSIGVIAHSPRSPLAKFLPLLKRGERKERFDGFYSLAGKLYADNREIFKTDHYRLMRMFQHAQQRHLTLSSELEQLVRRRLPLVNRTFQYATATREVFSAILSRKGEVGRILRMMHELDFLGRYIPEFGALTCLVQHEFFHRYTADEHTLVCIEKLDALIDSEKPELQEYRRLFEENEYPYVLYLALLLHDTGKSSNAPNHAEASAIFANRVAARLQLSSAQRRALVLLVDNHIALSETAQRRNVEDPATIATFSQIVKSQANLDALMLLTLADGQGTGDEQWSDWKEALVWELYENTKNFLLDDQSFYQSRATARAQMLEKVRGKLPEGYEAEIDAHFASMPAHYFQGQSSADVAAHIQMFREFIATQMTSLTTVELLVPAMRWTPRPERGHSEVWVAGWDRHELFARIAGAFAASQINVLSADIFTRTDSLVLDIFRVCNTDFQAVTDAQEIARVGKLFREASLQPDFDFDTAIQNSQRRRAYHLIQELDFPTQIRISNRQHPVYTLIDLQTPDRLGLLYFIVKALSELEIDFALSRIATVKGAAIDSFYVLGADGKKITEEARIAQIQRSLTGATQKANAVFERSLLAHHDAQK